MQWTADGLESVFFVRLEIGHLEGALHAMTHKMANTSKRGAHPGDSLGYLCRGKRPILPLKIVFRQYDEIENLFDGPMDICV